MFTIIKLFFKLMMLPLYVPLYILWALFGRALGGKHKVYDTWRF